MWTLFLVVFFLEAANSSVPVGENVTEVYIKLSLRLTVDAFFSLFQEAQIEDMPTFDPGAIFEGE